MNGKYYESDYEEAFVQLLQSEGWQYTYGENLVNHKVTEALYEKDLRDYIAANYNDRSLSANDVDGIVANLRNCGGATDYLALRNTFLLCQNGYTFRPTQPDKQPFLFEYIDFEHPEHNIFRCVNQYEMQQGKQTRIPDIMLFVNGIPVGIIELKNPTDPLADIGKAHTQITVRYKRDIFSLLKYCAIAVISDGSNSRLGTVFTPYEYFYAWKKVSGNENACTGVLELQSLVSGALNPNRLLQILRDFVYFPDVSEGTIDETEIVCRYPQFFATQKLRDNILQHLKTSADGDGKGGLYFGATGCGKTHTMLFLARQLILRCSDRISTPTILIIVDREDLETQAAKLFCNSKTFLCDKAIKIFEDRQELMDEMTTRKSGGIYITTIQKFTSQMGLLSERSNIICLSDEAHRTQNNDGSKLVIKDKPNEQGEAGAFVSYGFAKYIRTALPNATYVGFTGTPIDEAIHVFGDIVDQYTMQESKEDGITVDIKYEARLARVFLNQEQAKLIEDYYRQCEEDGARPEDVDKSKLLMSSMNVILGDPDRLHRLAQDMVQHYEKVCDDRPDLLQKAMIVCSDRKIAYTLYRKIEEIRPRWCKPIKALDESQYTADELEKMEEVPFLNIVTTRGKDDPKDMYDQIGDDDHRKFLDKQFKNEQSNFRVAIVVDMWITGFDVPSLAVMYNDKPLQKHTLIQTISRVNRRYKTKEYGLIVDYIGIRENMMKAMKKYGGGGDDTGKSDVDVALSILREELQILKDLTSGLDFTPFLNGEPLQRLMFLQTAAEFVLAQPGSEKMSFATMFKGHIKRLRAAYNICNPAGKLSDEETVWSQCLMGIAAFIGKITGTKYNVETMNRNVEQMVKEALSCTGVETILDAENAEDIFGSDFIKEAEKVKMPHTKFQLLVKMLRKAIKEYGKTNKTRADHFDALLSQIVESYNTRDNLTFANDVATETLDAVSKVVEDKVADLTEQLKALFADLNADKEEFKKLGITFEEKAFYDILIDIRNRNDFLYEDEKCLELSKKIKLLVDDSSIYADWINNGNIRSGLSSSLLVLLYENGYPPEWNDEIFERVLEQVENYKKNQ